MLEIGLKHTEEMIVEQKDTAAAVGSGGLDVFATPAMIGLMEMTCLRCAQKELEEGLGTVGVFISTDHKAATPMGMKVTCECELIEIDRKKLVFSTRCFDEDQEIGVGRHERFIIDSEKFFAKVQERIKK